MNPRRRRINRQRRLDRAAVLALYPWATSDYAEGRIRVRRFTSPRINGRMVYRNKEIWSDT